MKKTLLKSFAVAFAVLLSLTASATEQTVSPVLDVNFRTAAGNTAWQTVKNAADEGNNDFELTSTAGFFALQKYTVADLQNATKLVITLTVGSKNGVDAVRLWAFPDNAWTAESGIDDIYPKVQELLGVDLRATEGTPNDPLVKATKVKDSNPAKATFTIQGTALATIKENAAADGTFSILLTNDNLTNSNNKRSYLSNNTANDEANRPTLTATIETPTVTMNGAAYSTLEEAFDAAVAAGEDATIYVGADQTLTKRLTLNKAIELSIVPTQDITIKGQKNQMWFLVNINNGTLKVGSKDYKITLDGRGDDRSTFNNAYVTRRENSSKLYLTNIEFRDFICGNYSLVSCKNAGGGIYLEDIAINNCSTTGVALIDNQRDANDVLYLKGFLNVGVDCTGATIYTKKRIRLGDPDGTSIYDDFSATNTITINWGGELTEGTVVVVKVPGTAKDSFKLTADDWYLTRKASNGDIYMTQDNPSTVISTTVVNPATNSTVYNLSGQRVEKATRGLYIVGGKKIVK